MISLSTIKSEISAERGGQHTPLSDKGWEKHGQSSQAGYMHGKQLQKENDRSGQWIEKNVPEEPIVFTAEADHAAASRERRTSDSHCSLIAKPSKHSARERKDNRNMAMPSPRQNVPSWDGPSPYR